MLLELRFEIDYSNPQVVSLGCESNKIISGNACTVCEDGKIPNHAKDACKKCPPNEITKDGVVCEKCKGSQVPNNGQTACLDTGPGSIFNLDVTVLLHTYFATFLLQAATGTKITKLLIWFQMFDFYSILI